MSTTESVRRRIIYGRMIKKDKWEGVVAEMSWNEFQNSQPWMLLYRTIFRLKTGIVDGNHRINHELSVHMLLLGRMSLIKRAVSG